VAVGLENSGRIPPETDIKLATLAPFYNFFVKE